MATKIKQKLLRPSALLSRLYELRNLSVQWKFVNLAKLKKQNPTKLTAEADKLQQIFSQSK